MKKIMSLSIAAVFVAACAGNPPTWWNPSGKYQSSPAAKTPIETDLSTTQEDNSLTPAETYEEMILEEPLSDESLESDVQALQPSILED